MVRTGVDWLISQIFSTRSGGLAALSAVIAVALSAGCSGPRSIEIAGPEEPAQQAELRHWPLHPAELERQLRSGRIEVLEAQYAGAGLTGASRMKLRLVDYDGIEISVKWKAMPAALDGVNNSPRKELAAYELQKLFLDPEDFVVPTSVARCVPIEEFPNPENHRARPFEELSCELGVFSVWLENVRVPDLLFDPDRFNADPVYARHMGNFNLLTYLILHQDGRRGNFLVSRNGTDRRVFAVDNGVAFSGLFYNWFVPNWKSIRVSAVPEDSLDRLGGVRASEVAKLATVMEMRTTPEGGMLDRPPGPVRDRDEGIRVDGSILQMGLTEDEIEGVWERLEELFEMVEEGEVGVLPTSQ